LKNFWKFKNAVDGTDPELVLEGDIEDQDSWWDDNSISPQKFRQDLAALGNPSNINVHINSGGGSVFAGHAIHNMLKAHPATKTGYVDGLCASAAVLPLMACDKILMPSNAVIMVHKPAAMMYGSYNSDEMDKLSDTLATIQDSIVAAYQAKTGRSEKDLNKLMDAETWMNAAKAKAEGFCDDIIYNDPNQVNQATPLENKGHYMIVNHVVHDVSRYNLKSIQEAMNMPKITNGIIPANVSTKIAPDDTEWAAPTLEDFTDKSWDDLTDAEKKNISGHYAWEAQSPADTFGDLKLPHHQAGDGKVVWDGVKAAAGRLDQSDIPAVDIAKVKEHLAAHYKAFGKPDPWDINKSDNETAGESTQNNVKGGKQDMELKNKKDDDDEKLKKNKKVTDDDDDDGDEGNDGDDDGKSDKAKNKVIKTINDLRKIYPQLVDQVIAGERARLQEIDNIAKNLDPAMVEEAKYGEKLMNARDLSYQAMQFDNARGNTFMTDRKNELKNAETNKIDGHTDNQPENTIIADKIAAAANKKLHGNGGKK